MLWRHFDSPPVYELCQPMELNEGLLISHDFNEPVRYIQKAIYHQNCHKGKIPLLNTNINLVIDMFSENLPIVTSSWQQYTLDPLFRGGFLFSVAPIVYSLATLAVITWFLTIFVITDYMIKPSLILKISVVMASIYMLITVIKAIVVLHMQQRQGYLHGEVLLDILEELVYLKVLDFLVTFFLQINQVQIIMRLFPRQSDKRLIFLVGLSCSIASQTLWSVSKFHLFGDAAEAGKIIPAFTYLIRISMSISYAAIFTAFLITKVKMLMQHPSIWAISILSIVLIYAPVAFFIADVSSSWMYELSEIFSAVTYVVCVVIPWDWCNKYNIIKKIQEKEGILGRKFYEDELYELDKLELFVEEEEDEDSDGFAQDGHSPSQSLLARQSSRFSHSDRSIRSSNNADMPGSRDGLAAKEPVAAKERLAHGYSFIRDGFVKVTDLIISTGMAIPRSVSAGSPVGGGNSSQRRSGGPHFYATDHSAERPSSGTTSGLPTNTRRTGDVYVYDTKDIRISFDE